MELLRELAGATDRSGGDRRTLVAVEELARAAREVAQVVKDSYDHHMEVEDNICTIWVAISADLVRALRTLVFRRASGRWSTKEGRVSYYLEKLKTLVLMYSLAVVHLLAKREEREAIFRRADELYEWIAVWVEDYARRNGHLPQHPAGTGSRPRQTQPGHLHTKD